MRRMPSLDLGLYIQALPLLVLNPGLLAAPFLMAVVGIVVNAAGGPGPANQAASIGCSIKWKAGRG